MTTYRLIGSATTNSQGIATYTYTGTGAGELDIIASTDSTITESSLVSEIYEVLDCIYFDSGVTGTNNTDWFNRNNLTVNVTDNGTVLTGGASAGNYMPNIKDTSSGSITNVTEFAPPFVFEYDLVSFDDGNYHSCGVGSIGRNYTQLGLTGNNHIKIVYDGSSVSYYIDNSETAIYTANMSTTPTYCAINVNSEHTQTIKNIRIYSI